MAGDAGPRWTFLTNHAQTLLCIAQDPQIRLRDIGQKVGITERAAHRIVAELTEAGYLTRGRVAGSEAWSLCVDAAGGHVARRRVFRAAAVGYLANLINGQVGVAARIAALRRSAPQESPPVSALVTAEVPILAVEAGLAALT